MVESSKQLENKIETNYCTQKLLTITLNRRIATNIPRNKLHHQKIFC